MNINEVLSFYTDEDKAKEITERNVALIDKALQLTEKPIVKTEEDYQKVMDAKRMFGYLTCFCFNTKNENQDEVSRLEGVYGNVLSRYNKRLRIKDKDTRTVAKYLAWTYFFTSAVNHVNVLKKAAELGVLKKESYTEKDGSKGVNLYVFGLHYKVGDNVFKPDRLGREHRCYVDTIGRQASPVTVPKEELEKFKTECKDIIATIPELSECDYVTYVGDGKGCIRAIPFPNADREYIVSHF